jgi:hypothetical protein
MVNVGTRKPYEQIMLPDFGNWSTYLHDCGILLAPFGELFKCQFRILIPVHIPEYLVHSLISVST